MTERVAFRQSATYLPLGSKACVEEEDTAQPRRSSPPHLVARFPPTEAPSPARPSRRSFPASHPPFLLLLPSHTNLPHNIFAASNHHHRPSATTQPVPKYSTPSSRLLLLLRRSPPFCHQFFLFCWRCWCILQPRGRLVHSDRFSSVDVNKKVPHNSIRRAAILILF